MESREKSIIACSCHVKALLPDEKAMIARRYVWEFFFYGGEPGEVNDHTFTQCRRFSPDG